MFRLHEVGTVVAGPTFWAVEQTAEVLSAYREFLPAAPRELNGFFAFHDGAARRRRSPRSCTCARCAASSGATSAREEDAAEAMAPLLDALPEPLMHGVQPMPHPAIQSAFDGLYPPGDQWYWRADFVKEIPDEAVASHARFGAEMPTMQSTMHLYPIDGAAHDVGLVRHGLELPRRDAGARCSPASTPTRRTSSAIRDWTVGYFEALHPYSAGGAYVNMMMDEGQERVRAALPRQLRPAGADQGDVRPGEPLPRQPEHPARGVGR